MTRISKTALYTAISAIALLVLFVGGAAAYVWYTGQNTPEITNTPVPENDTPDTVITPTKPAENARASASVQVLTSPVVPGDNASISIKTLPTSICTIKVVYNEVPSTDSGLVAKTADEFGIVSWTWTVGKTVPQGKWPVTVTCMYNGRSAVVQGDLVVAQ